MARVMINTPAYMEELRTLYRGRRDVERQAADGQVQVSAAAVAQVVHVVVPVGELQRLVRACVVRHHRLL